MGINEIVNIVSSEYAFKHKVLPLSIHNDTLELGVTSVNNQINGELEFITGLNIKTTILPEYEILSELESRYNTTHVETRIKTGNGQFEVVEKENKNGDNGKNNKVVKEISTISLVNKIITEAIDSSASDIHVEAYENIFRIRYRCDGVLQQVMEIPVDNKQALISRLKIMADLDIAEKRRPQDGRIRVNRGERTIDIRVSTLPTDFGEKVVLRILDKDQLNLNLNELGFLTSELDKYKEIVNLPYGMVLVTGPTGSGKTTTLYATLNYLNSPEVNILTIEDPIEYNLQGINQSQVKRDIGYTFANALRSFLRQDPDIIMVGEIRDQETAEIAIRSALTGHLVLSTLHTNNAVETISRLIDMDQEPFLIASAVKMIIAQRLLRKICPNCKEENKDSYSIDQFHKLYGESGLSSTLYKGRGCEKCNHTGYKGRIAIFENLIFSEEIKEAIHLKIHINEIYQLALEKGMKTLNNGAFEKLKQGITTIEEIVKETMV